MHGQSARVVESSDTDQSRWFGRVFSRLSLPFVSFVIQPPSPG